MTSPGGAEVGRVSVRVLPDTSGFKQRLEAELARITAGVEVKVKVEPDLSNFHAELRAELARIAGESAKVKITFDIDENGLRERLRAIVAEASRGITAKIRVEWTPSVSILRNELRVLVLAAQRGVDARVRVRLDVDRSELDRLSGLLGSLGSSGGGGSAGQLTQMVQRWGALLAAATPLLVIAGAGITEAWAAVSAAIAAIPGALVLLGAPLATVVLGVDGILHAFTGSLEVIERMKKSISDTFSQTLSMNGAALNLKLTLEGLLAGGSLNRMAVTISNAMGQSLQVISDHTKQIEGLIDGASERIAAVGESLASILETTFKVLEDQRVFDALVEPIKVFAAEYKAAIAELTKDGTLSATFDGLREILGDLTEGFVHLVNNGIKVFAASAPGVSGFLDKLTAFFDKFDWAKLGEAVGRVFGGIGDTLAKIPQSTIDAIVRGFEQLGRTFKDASLQQAFANIAKAIPEILALFAVVIQVIGRVASALVGLIKIAEGTINSFILVFQVMTGSISPGDAAAKFALIKQQYTDGFGSIKDAVTFGGQEVDDELDRSLGKHGATISKNGAFIKKETDNALKPGDKDYVPEWQQKLNGIDTALKTGFDNINVTGQAGADLVAKGLSAPIKGKSEVEQSWKDTVAGAEIAVGSAGVDLNAKAVEVSTKTTDSLKPQGAQTPSSGGLSQAWDEALGFILEAILTFGEGGSESGRLAGANISAGFGSGLIPMPGHATAAAAGAAAEMGRGMGEVTRQVQLGVGNTVRESAKAPGEVKSSLGNTSSILEDPGRGFMQGLLRGIIDAANAVYTYVAGIAARIAALKGPLPKDRRVLIPAGKALMQGLFSGLQTGFVGVSNLVSGMAQQISFGFSSIDLGSSLNVDGLPQALRAVHGAVTSTVNGTISADDVNGIADSVGEALSGWNVEIDQAGIAKLVNKQNTRNRRR